DGIAAHGACEAALRADRKARRIDVTSGLLDAPREALHTFDLRGLRADEAEHDPFVPRHEPERPEAPGAGTSELEEDIVHARPAEDPLGHRIVSPFAQIHALIVTATDVDAHRDR